MAYIAQPLQTGRPDEEQELTPGAPLAPSVSGGTLIGGGGLPQAGSAATPPPPTQEGTGWTNLQRYLELNAPQASKMAGRVAESVEEGAQKAGEAIRGGRSAFEADVEKQNVISQDPIEKAKTAAETLTPEERAQFIQYRKGEYLGPESLQDTSAYYDLARQVEEAQTRTGLTETSAGRQQLLDELATDPTRGKTLLNELLLSGDPGARDRLAQARQTGEALTGQLSGAVEASKAAAEAKQAELQGIAEQIHREFYGPQEGKLGGVLGGLESQIASGYKAAQGDVAKQLADAYRYAYDAPSIGLSRELSPEQRTRWEERLSRELATPEGYQFWMQTPFQASQGTTPTMPETYVPSFSFSREQYASPEQYARERALEELLGEEFDILQTGASGEAGQYQQMLDDLISRAPTEAPTPEFYTSPTRAYLTSSPRYVSEMYRDLYGRYPETVEDLIGGTWP